MAIAAVTGGTDGGFVEDSLAAATPALSKLSLYWSKADLKQMEQREKDEKGLNFARVRYPADSRTDCWFCLASEGCEKVSRRRPS
jgi:hypothetical protein